MCPRRLPAWPPWRVRGHGHARSGGRAAGQAGRQAGCGEAAGRAPPQQLLHPPPPSLPPLQVVQCEREAVGEEIEDADVVVPLMCPLGAELLRRARRAKLVLQFGVGVEGVDIPEVGVQRAMGGGWDGVGVGRRGRGGAWRGWGTDGARGARSWVGRRGGHAEGDSDGIAAGSVEYAWPVVARCMRCSASHLRSFSQLAATSQNAWSACCPTATAESLHNAACSATPV